MISLISVLLIQAASAQQTRAVELPAWLAGAWVRSNSEEGWTEEWWSTPRAGIMLGASRSGQKETLGFFEHMRIELSTTGVQFCALPRGNSGTCFPAVTSSASEIVFENRSHDYPTRIVYRREAGGISAEVSGPDGARRQSWRFVPLAN